MDKATAIRAERFDELADAYRTLATAARCPHMVSPVVQQRARESIKTLSLLVNVAEGAPVAEAVKGSA